jgi:hypothetical protein
MVADPRRGATLAGTEFSVGVAGNHTLEPNSPIWL